MSSPIHHSTRSFMPSALRACAACGAAALVAWAMVSVPGTRDAAELTVSASLGPPSTATIRAKERTAPPQPQVPDRHVEAEKPPLHIAPAPAPPPPPQAKIKQADASSEPLLPAGVRAFIAAVLD